MKIGVCGTGRMGSSIAQRLLAVGHEVAVWNRDAAKTTALTDAGATLFASPAELAVDRVHRPIASNGQEPIDALRNSLLGLLERRVRHVDAHGPGIGEVIRNGRRQYEIAVSQTLHQRARAETIRAMV